jgi:Myb-like DNA-binding protein FlbD
VQSSYSYHPLLRSLDRREEHPGRVGVHPSLPSLFNRDVNEPTRYYSDARQPSSHSPQAAQLPPPQAFESCSGMSTSRPHNLELQFTGPFPPHRARWETPMPSPSGYSIISADGAPSLITDTGSESTRSPRGAASPVELTTLAPLVGGRSERKNSSTRFLPQHGFAIDDDDHTTLQMPYDPCKRRASVQLPPLQPSSAAPIFREPIYQSEKPQLLTQPAHHHHHHHHSLPTGQRPLPAFRSLAEPGRVPDVQSSTSPLARQLPAPYTLPAPVKESKSAPASPREGSRDQRMNLSTMLS